MPPAVPPGMRIDLREPPRFVWRTLDKFFGNNGPGSAAALSFYTFFSLPALLSLLLVLVSVVGDPAAMQRAITSQVGALIGKAGAEQVAAVIRSVRSQNTDPSIAAILSGIAVLLGATTAFAQLQDALNRAWSVKPDPRRGQIRNFLAKRIFSFGVVLVVAFLLLISLALTAAVTSVSGALSQRLGAPDWSLQGLDFVLSFAVVTILFAAMLKLLPDAIIDWRDVWFGAIATALLFVGGKWAIGAYLGSTDPGSAYGAAGSLAVVLIWVYYTSMIVLFGAQMTRVWAERYGRGIKPERGAVEFIEQEKTVKAG